MESTPSSNQLHSEERTLRQKGVALFMVISAMTVLAILVTEFTYIAQVNQRMAYDHLDGIKALYMAKTGFKIGLLQIKAFQKVNEQVKTIGSGANIPKSMIDQIWQQPIFFPIPTDLPGLTGNEKDLIGKFMKESSLEGKFSVNISSESRPSINMFLPNFIPTPTASASPSATPSATISGDPSTQTQNPQPSSTPTVKVEELRQSLKDHISNILERKMQDDQEFATEYRDLRIDDLMDAIYAWGDRTYERRNLVGRDAIKAKKAPFYSMQELHMVDGIDDKLYDLIAPTLTASTSQGINVNEMQKPTLHSLLPRMTNEEVEDFFKFRDDPKDDNKFKKVDDFYTYLVQKVPSFRGDQKQVDDFKAGLEKRRIYLLVDENSFKITARGQMGQATRIIEAWVVLDGSGGTKPAGKTGATSNPNDPNQTNSGDGQPNNNAQKTQSNAGLKVVFMRIL